MDWPVYSYPSLLHRPGGVFYFSIPERLGWANRRLDSQVSQTER
jgi:hypothetical protein